LEVPNEVPIVLYEQPVHVTPWLAMMFTEVPETWHAVAEESDGVAGFAFTVTVAPVA
jgi:hypothetical protein